MDNTLTVEALIAIWDDLPALAGDQWPSLERQLKALLAAFDDATEQSVRDRISQNIQEALDPLPAVVDRFDDAFDRLSSEEAGVVRTWPSLRIKSLLGRLNREVKKYTRYTDISCPRRVWIETKRISVVVRLTMQPSISSDIAEPLLIQSELPVRVRIQAPSFDILNAVEQETLVLPAADSPPLIFDLRPRQVGYTAINFDFFQAGNPVGSSSVQVEITAYEVSAADEVHAGPLLRAGEGVVPPDYILYISYEHSQGEPSLAFELRPAGGVGQRFAPVPLNKAPAEYAAQIYESLTTLTQHVDPVTKIVLGMQRTLDPQEADDRLQEVGKSLWADLVPLEMQQLYASEREKWYDRSLLIVSDEPHIPWELLWPYGSWGQDGPLCLSMRLSRWLRRGPQGRANYEPEPAVSLHHFALVVPPDSGLSGAQKEKAFLARLIQQYGLMDTSPAEPTRALVKKLLQHGDYSWFHVASHGNFYSDNPNNEAALWLQNQQPLTANALLGEAEKYLCEHRSGFVFNACEVGRQSWSITGIGGWANRLLSAGAGVFLAPQWIVNDSAALRFTRALYQALFAREPIAEAVRQGRLAARREGDPSWLAYSLYAHPNAR